MLSSVLILFPGCSSPPLFSSPPRLPLFCFHHPCQILGAVEVKAWRQGIQAHKPPIIQPDVDLSDFSYVWFSSIFHEPKTCIFMYLFDFHVSSMYQIHVSSCIWLIFSLCQECAWSVNSAAATLTPAMGWHNSARRTRRLALSLPWRPLWVGSLAVCWRRHGAQS